MDSVVTDDQRMLLDTSARFIEETYPLAQVRAGAYADEAVRAEYLRATAALGWYSMLVPERLGGGSVTANGMVDAALLASTRGSALQPGPFVAANVVGWALAQADDDRFAEVVRQLVGGEATAAWAVGAPFVAAASGGAVTAEAAAGGHRLDGVARLVQDAALADHLLVTADGGGGRPAQFLLGADTPGVEVTGLDSLDLSRSFAEVRFDGAHAPTDAEVRAPGELVERQLAIACVLTAAESVGVMDRDFATALQYAKDRIVFGRPIGSFQAIKHLLADTSLALEMSMAITLAAATSLGAGDDHGIQAAAMAKAFVADAGQRLAQDCFQVFGGIGFTWEHDQHLYLRRLATDAALYGSSDWQRERLCQLAGL